MRELSKQTSNLLFILLTGVLVVIAFISYNKIRQFNKSVDLVIHTHVVKDNIVELRSNIKDAETGQRGYLLTGDSVFLQPFIAAQQRSKLIFVTLDSLLSDNARQQKNLEKLKTIFDEKYLLLNKNLKLLKNKNWDSDANTALLKGKNKMDKVRNLISLMLQTEDTLLEQRIQVKDRSATITPIILLLLSLFSIVALTLFFFRLQKETNLRVSTEKLVEVEAEARKQIEENLRQISDYKYALDESSIVAITDQKGIIKYVNDNFCTISKYTRQELIGQDHRIISSGYHPKAFIRNIWTTIANGKLWKGELKNKAKDGTIYWVDTTIVPFLDELGKPYQYIAIRADITAQKISEETIEKMATHLTLATDSANVGTWSLNIKTQKLEWSAVHKRMWGYDELRNDLEYKDWHKLILPEDKENAFEKIEQARVHHTVYEAEYYINRANDGTLRYMRSFGKYYYNDKGEAETLTGISIEITEQKQAKEKIRLLNTTLEEKVKSRTEELYEKNIKLELANAELASFSYVASHDLKEPLRKIQMFSKLIIETEKFSDKTQDYFNRIISSGERMQNLIDSLLNFSHVNTTELVFEECDLNTIVEELKNDLSLRILEKQAIIEHENLPTINGVYIQLFQLFANLLDNAIKYSRPEIKSHIKITSLIMEGKKIEHPSANQEKEYHAIKIADNGIGFEKEYATKIFELFQRLHGKNEFSGTGIGLAIVKKTLTNHNGFIVAEGKLGIGSTFHIYIPTS